MCLHFLPRWRPPSRPGFCLFASTKSRVQPRVESPAEPFIFLSNCANCDVFAAYMITLLSRTIRLITGAEGSWEKAQSLPISALALINPPPSAPQSAVGAPKRPRRESVNAGSYSYTEAHVVEEPLYIKRH